MAKSKKKKRGKLFVVILLVVLVLLLWQVLLNNDFFDTTSNSFYVSCDGQKAESGEILQLNVGTRYNFAVKDETVIENKRYTVELVRWDDHNNTYTSDTTLSISDGNVVSWSATAESGYTLSTSSGQFAIGGDYAISPTATVESFTVTATVTPSDANCTLNWTLAWASGKFLTGSVSDYVTMTIASDGKSVTLTFKKNFSAGEMVLTCYVVENTSVKATCTVKCGS